jgi:hypothetical protein
VVRVDQPPPRRDLRPRGLPAAPRGQLPAAALDGTPNSSRPGWVSASRWGDDCPPSITIYGDAEGMTAAQARQLAAALLDSADALDKITTR